MGHRQEGARAGRAAARIEKRRSTRAPLVVRVDYSTVEALFSEFTTNINEGGLFIETERPAPIGTVVSLQFRLPGSEEPIKVDGRVVWTSAERPNDVPGMGIEFEGLDHDARARINALVRGLRTPRREHPAA
jgi:type IV pilus assembly protein PilZ